jgi:RNA polymerase sigma factor (sigma-70 family)
MKFEISSNPKGIHKYELNQVSELLGKKAEKLKKYLKKYRKTITVEVHLKHAGKGMYALSLIADLKSKPIIIKEKGDNLLKLVTEAFEKFKLALIRQLTVERKKFSRRRLLDEFERYREIHQPLTELKKEDDSEVFVALLKKALPGLRGYLRRKVKTAQLSYTLRVKAKKAADLVDELYLRLYNKYNGHIDNFQDFQKWLYNEADRLVDEIIETEKGRTSKESVEQLLKYSNRELEEIYSVDGDGEYVMLDEINDPTYHSGDPLFDEGIEQYYEIFSDEEEIAKGILNKTEDDLSLHELEMNIHHLLNTFDAKDQSIFDLYMFEHLELEDIAVIKDIEVTKVEETINRIKETLKQKLILK